MTTRARKLEPVKVQDGTVLAFDALEWIEPAWEFDYPSAILSPVVRSWENGRDIDGIVEDICIDACVDGELRSEPIEDGIVARRWKLSTLQRAFRDSLTGKQFPSLRYKARRVTVRFYLDDDGELTFEVRSAPAATSERNNG